MCKIQGQQGSKKFTWKLSSNSEHVNLAQNFFYNETKIKGSLQLANIRINQCWAVLLGLLNLIRRTN
jgi:hypothetical protein